MGQQNFINVPSGEATCAKGIFFQQQINMNNLLQSNTTIDYGIGKGWEAGLNVLRLNIKNTNFTILQNDTDDVDPYNPIVMANVLKCLNPEGSVVFSSGMQYGGNFTARRRMKPCGLVYLNAAIKDKVIDGSILVSGIYYNTLHYGGEGNRFGGWIGCEIPVSSWIHVTAESVFGSNALCYSSGGVILYPHPKLPVTLGVQLPNVPNNTFGFVMEITWVP